MNWITVNYYFGIPKKSSVAVVDSVTLPYVFFFWLRHYATSQKVAGSVLDEVIGFFSWPNPSNHTVALGWTQLLTEISTRNLPGGKGWLVRKADNHTAIFETIV
jgi:hypothetical protein